MKNDAVINELRRLNVEEQDINKLSRLTKGWMSRCLELQQQDYTLYGITVTYKPLRQGLHDWSPEALNKNFKHLFIHRFFRYHLFDGDKRWFEHHHDQVPYMFAFMDDNDGEHEWGPHLRHGTFGCYEFPEQKHHHAIMAVHPCHVKLMEAVLGKNTLLDHCPSALSSYVERADISWVMSGNRRRAKYAGGCPLDGWVRAMPRRHLLPSRFRE